MTPTTLNHHRSRCSDTSPTYFWRVDILLGGRLAVLSLVFEGHEREDFAVVACRAAVHSHWHWPIATKSLHGGGFGLSL